MSEVERASYVDNKLDKSLMIDYNTYDTGKCEDAKEEDKKVNWGDWWQKREEQNEKLFKAVYSNDFKEV